MQVSQKQNPTKTVWVNWQHATVVEQENNPSPNHYCISDHCLGWLRYELVSDPTEIASDALVRLNVQHGGPRSVSAVENLKEYYGA